MYNRAHELFSFFSAEDRRYNAFAEGFENIWEGYVDNNAKFINSHQVLLGGFDKSREELVLV